MSIKSFCKFCLVISVVVLMSCGSSKKQLADVSSGASSQLTIGGNSLYHQTQTKKLKTGHLIVKGEISESVSIDLQKFYNREVFVKEALITSGGEPQFIGAFRYKGYSLFDLLNDIKIDKNNKELFRPVIDLYIKIENDLGEYVVFSWSEIFHSIHPHEVIIATEVAQIKPHKKEVDYETSTAWKVVAANDLFCFRNLNNPTVITILSFAEKDYPINRDINPLYSERLKFIMENEREFEINSDFNVMNYTDYFTTFYGMGMGYHENPQFRGVLLNEVLKDFVKHDDANWIKGGLICFASVDGYRSIFSFSELFNRSDQVFPMLAVHENPDDGGSFRIFLPADFYADRSVKALKEVYFFLGD